MRSIEFESRQPPHFSGLSDPRFFYGNLYIEVLAALRFGIEARKGLILFTGDAGTGKSAVLHELTRELNSKTACILVSDPHVRFTELLRLILRTLGLGADADDEAALIRCCKTAVRSQLKKKRIISLAFDDAQHLPDEVIESLTKHFLGKGFDPDNNLLQIVLAGRPELRKRLFIPPLRSLDTQVEIECRLRPLDVKEVELYVKHRLCGAALPAGLLDHDAIERIAVYSDGRPGLVNAICDRALQLADQSHLGKITSDVIAGAARDLELKETAQNSKPRDEASGFRSTVVAQSFVSFNDDRDRKRWFSPAQGARRAILVSLTLVLFGVSAAWLQGESAISYVREWGIKLDETVGSKQQTPARAKIEAERAPLAAPQDPTPIPNMDVPLPRSDEPETSALSLGQTDESVGLPASVSEEHFSAANPDSSRAPANRDRQESSRKGPEQRRELTKQISKAIENRAIVGVEVSLSEGIAYLDGKVATSEQRDAAERATRSVPDVREIRNRIAIE